MKINYGIFYIVAFLILGSVLIIAPSDKPIDPNPVLTGRSLADNPSNYDEYVMGVIDSASVTDSGDEFTCNKPIKFHDRKTEMDIMEYIIDHPVLQDQPITFSVLNAYHELYCNDNKTIP